FVAFWLAGAALAVAWSSAAARHLVGVAALGWFVTIFIGSIDRSIGNPVAPIIGGAALLMGLGLVLTRLHFDPLRALGLTLSTYAGFALALVLAPVGFDDIAFRLHEPPGWAGICGFAGVVLTFGVAAVSHRAGQAFAGQAFAGLALFFAMCVAMGWS